VNMGLWTAVTPTGWFDVLLDVLTEVFLKISNIRLVLGNLTELFTSSRLFLLWSRLVESTANLAF
jgi:hypothetical protein